MDLTDIFLSAGQEPTTEFNHFEPWDVEERPKWLIDFASDLGIELLPEGEPFQTGMIMSTVFIAIAIAGNQLGKSYQEVIESIMVATGKIPVSLRYEKGADTGIPRCIDDDDRRKLNILRFGRRSVETGEIIDYCPYFDGHGNPTDNEPEAMGLIKPDDTWDCGNIIGCGIYPVIKIPTNKTLIRVCSWKQAKDDMWIPTLQRLWPNDLRDMSRGTGGFGVGDNTFYSHNGTLLKLITYESGYESMEASKPWLTVLDEEPKDRRFYTGALTHSKYIRMSFTPIHGISWSKEDLVDRAGKDKNIEVFKATQYDCPYKTKEGIERETSTMKSWEKISKVLGYYASQTGEPYYDREKVNEWIGQHLDACRMVEFEADKMWHTGAEIPRLNIKTNFNIDEPTQATFYMAEDVHPEGAYYMSVDTAKGIKSEEGVKDIDNSSYIMWRKMDEVGVEDVPVLFMKTLMPEICAWREALKACGYYNNALICPEVTGESGAVFLVKIIEYPHIVRYVKVRQATRQEEESVGFTMRKNSRAEVFKLVDEWVKRHEVNPRFPFLPVLQEISECIIGKNGRPDHPRMCNNDSLLAFGIGLWVKANAIGQVRNNKIHSQYSESRSNRLPPEGEETRPLIGSDIGLDEMERRGYR